MQGACRRAVPLTRGAARRGRPLWVSAAARFVRQGGTPAPVRLVVSGLYRHARNPMYVAVLAMVAGQALLLGSPGALVHGLWRSASTCSSSSTRSRRCASGSATTTPPTAEPCRAGCHG
jgi:Phospholipid methyltransferase